MDTGCESCTPQEFISGDDDLPVCVEMDDENWENTFLEELTAAEGEAEDASQEMDEEDDEYTVKTFGLLQPYFGCFSCMPAVYVIHYKLQGSLPISF